MAKLTIMCAECTREFEWEGGMGRGRRPVRCEKCRDGHGHARKNAASKPKVTALAPVKRAPKLPELVDDSAAVVRGAGQHANDMPGFLAQMHGEIEALEHRVAIRLRVIHAVERYLATAGK